jgi:hypothetical protein
MRGPRGFTKDKHIIPDVYFHHYSAVRRTPDAVREKILTSYIGDGAGNHVADLDWWMEEIWPRMPHVENFHYFPECRLSNLWKGIKTIGPWNIPQTLRGKDIFRQFYPECKWGAQSLLTERQALLNLAKRKRLVVDLGTATGHSAILFSLVAQHVITIDLFERVSEGDSDYCKDTYSKDRVPKEVVQKALLWFSNIESIHGWTHELVKTPHNVDLLYINGDHAYEGVRRDFLGWWNRVTYIKRDGVENGLIVFHDNSDKHEGVQKFVQELTEKEPSVRRLRNKEVESLAIFEKVDGEYHGN